ncbi:MAG: hypothetical protein NZT61_02080 [Deltaproteobacteria bacterium]|nr:hypothetical protein [Deltaproteobacteria bacterium]MCX7952839.1 hypothetical protein [Deltaproteobacteria bacterium]
MKKGVLLVVLVLFGFVLVGCGSSSKQRLGESFALLGIAKLEEEEDEDDGGGNGGGEKSCSFKIINEVIKSPSPEYLCIVLENRLKSQMIILRDYEVEFRIPGALVQPPVYRISLAGTLLPKESQSGSSGGSGSNTTPQNPVQTGLFFTQDEALGNKASIPIIVPPIEFAYWLIANIGAMPPIPVIPMEAIYKAYGQTSPAGDWVSTNKIFFRLNLAMSS